MPTAETQNPSEISIRIQNKLENYLQENDISISNFLSECGYDGNEGDINLDDAIENEMYRICDENEEQYPDWMNHIDVGINMPLCVLIKMAQNPKEPYRTFVNKVNQEVLRRIHEKREDIMSKLHDMGNHQRFKKEINGVKMTPDEYLKVRDAFESFLREVYIAGYNNGDHINGNEVGEEDFLPVTEVRDGKVEIVYEPTFVYGGATAKSTPKTESLQKLKDYGIIRAIFNKEMFSRKDFVFIAGDTGEDTFQAMNEAGGLNEEFLRSHIIPQEEVIKVRAIQNLIERYNKDKRESRQINIGIPYIETILLADDPITISSFESFEICISSDKDLEALNESGLIELIETNQNLLENTDFVVDESSISPEAIRQIEFIKRRLHRKQAVEIEEHLLIAA